MSKELLRVQTHSLGRESEAWSSQMNCPVCNNTAAEDITPHTFDGKTFRCPTCGEYDIVGSVYEPGALKALEPDKRQDALARAQIVATLGHRPRITTYDL